MKSKPGVASAVAPGDPGVVAIPPELKIDKAAGIRVTADFARKNVAGLMAVGVPFAEALKPFTATLTIKDLVALSCEVAPSGLEQMRALYDMQRDIEDKAAFGQACLEAGFSPVGVALCGVDPSTANRAGEYDMGQAHRKEREEASRLIEAFGVDTWMAEKLTYASEEIVIQGGDTERMAAPKLIIPYRVRFKNMGEGLTIPWLTEVGGGLSVDYLRQVSFPALTYVGGFLAADRAIDIDFPALKTVEGALRYFNRGPIVTPVLTFTNGQPVFSEADQARQVLSGLLAVGVEPREAFQGYHDKLPTKTLVEMAFEMVPDRLKLTPALFHILESRHDLNEALSEFGKMMLEGHNLNPLSVAACADGIFKAKYYAHAMGVAPWLVEGLTTKNRDGVTGPFTLEIDLDVDSMAGFGGSGIPGDLVLDSLKMRGDFSRCNDYCGQIELGGSFMAHDARSLSLPGLRKVAGTVGAIASGHVNLNGLVEVGHDLVANSSVKLSLQNLERVGGMLSIPNTTMFSAPKLKSVREIRQDGANGSFDSSRLHVGKGAS